MYRVLKPMKNKLQVPSSKEELFFLEGPKSRLKELLFTFSICKEFILGFRILHFVGPCITVFGSARFKENHPYYEIGVEVGKKLAELGFTVMTGGGPGIMEAANKGAFQHGGLSVGAKILLPFEQYPNVFMHSFATFKYFFVRKFLLFKYSYGFIVLPGGVGTMDELFEALTLIQTKKIKDFPIVVLGTQYYASLDIMLNTMADEGAIDKEDLSLIKFTDSIQEAIEHIQKYSVEKYGLKSPIPSGILGENNPRN